MSGHALTRKSDGLAPLRWLDVLLVWAAAPFVVLLEAPLLGYLVAAVAWTAQRAVAVAIERRARDAETVKRAVGLNLFALVGRAWVIGLTILAVGLAGTRDDGLTAGLLCLVAFTVYFAMTLLLRALERSTPNR